MPNTKEKGKLIEVLSKHIPYGHATLCLIAEELIAEGVRLEEKRATSDGCITKAVREKLVDQLRWWSAECDRTNFGCQARKLLVEAADYIAHGATVQEWISVKDRLPPYNHDVLVYRPNMATKILVDCYVGYYGEDDGEWYEGWARYGKDIHNKPLITHWAYLPQPPKGE